MRFDTKQREQKGAKIAKKESQGGKTPKSREENKQKKPKKNYLTWQAYFCIWRATIVKKEINGTKRIGLTNTQKKVDLR